MDYMAIGKLRAGIESEYSLFKHISKFGVSVIWFSSFSAIATVVLFGKKLLNRFRESDRLLYELLVVWGIGSISWNFIMRQHSQVHAFTHLHSANYILFLTSLIFAWGTQTQKIPYGYLLVGHFLQSVVVIQLQIFEPFKRMLSH
jgi:hypothetical protein